MEQGIGRREVIAELTRSPHGDFAAYLPVGQRAARDDGEFLAHLIAWNHKNGQIRDSKTALPVVTLGVSSFNGELRESSLAHLAQLSPRDLVKAYRFAPQAGPARNAVRKLVRRYLREREADESRWEYAAVAHRSSMKTLYAATRTRPAAFADLILFKRQYPSGSLFEAVANLGALDDVGAAGMILKRKVPFLVAKGALGARMKSEPLLLALIQRMSPTELATNARFLQKAGMETSPALRAAFEEAMEKATTSKKATLKTTKAAKATTGKMQKKLRALQERQIDANAIKGNWLVLGDRSWSMDKSIAISREVSATLARYCEGAVRLVFFDTTPRALDVSGKTYEEILDLTKRIVPNGGTSIGCGLQWALDRKFEADGIAVVSDGGENNPPSFASVYEKYCRQFDSEPPVYFWKVEGDPDHLTPSMVAAGHDLQALDLCGKTPDQYSIPNMAQAMRASRYSLIDEIMETPLLRLSDVFKAA